MGWGRKKDQTTGEKTDVGVEEEQLSTAQEAIPLPWIFGTRRIALRWISRVYNKRARPAPVARPGKK